MATTIKLKKSSTAGVIPDTDDLVVGELAVNTADGKLYTKHTDNSIVTIKGSSSEVLDLENANSALGTRIDSEALVVEVLETRLDSEALVVETLETRLDSEVAVLQAQLLGLAL